jgi:hypothetical protein
MRNKGTPGVKWSQWRFKKSYGESTEVMGFKQIKGEEEYGHFTDIQVHLNWR